MYKSSKSPLFYTYLLIIELNNVSVGFAPLGHLRGAIAGEANLMTARYPTLPGGIVTEGVIDGLEDGSEALEVVLICPSGFCEGSCLGAVRAGKIRGAKHTLFFRCG